MSKINYNVPFYSNTADDTHCFQAALKMVVKYFEPSKDFYWRELDIITAKKEGLWTWPLAGMLWLRENGYTVTSLELFDYEAFIDRKEDYLVEFAGEEVAKEQIKHSDINQEFKFAQKLVDLKVVSSALPTLDSVREFLEQGYVLICLINSNKLNPKEGYVGHFIVVKGIEPGFLVVHDPGLPAIENRKVSFEEFEQAWADPNENVKNLIAIRKSVGDIETT